ncbi:MAG: cobalamin biosynthesis protein CobW [Ruminococcaceae bacterium]|nr:cobalamin biosynthesis protein CobW [Oscillospiraceae bacterium]
MTKIDIYSGFLGAGKTTLIKKMIQEGYKGQKLVLIENEFGEIGIDGGFLQDAGINITEMNSGCICCSLVGDFGKALQEVIERFNPDRVIIEPSGVGKLSDVIAAVQKVTGHDVELGYTVAVADASKVKVYMKNFGEFYNNQIETATTIILSRTADMKQEKLDTAVALLREHNADAAMVVTPWEALTGEQLIVAMEGNSVKAEELAHEEEHHCCGHHHHDEEHEEHHCCGHHHHHDEEHEEHHCCGHHHHDEEHEEHHCCGHHHHEHHHDEHCDCGCHDHDHHDHHHHADEVFTSWGVETAKKFTQEQIHEALHILDSGKYGTVLRAKGIIAATDGTWIHFDMVPEEINIRSGAADIIGKLCVIGAQLDEAGVAKLFGV